MSSQYPNVYQLNNFSLTKFLNVVIEIEGFPTKFSTLITYKGLRYGDPDLHYGDPNLVYGGLIPRSDTKAYLSSESGFSLSQRIEPEQGKGNASTINLVILDLNGEVTKLVSPGQSLDEILGGKQVKMHLGYQNSSYPEDYFVVFRGYVTQTTLTPTKVSLQLSDVNFKMKQQVCFMGKTQIKPVSYTFLPTDVNTGSDTINISAPFFQNGVGVVFSGTLGSTLPSGLSTGTTYWVVNQTGSSFQVSDTVGGAPINFLSQGTGTFYAIFEDLGLTSTSIPVYKTDGFLEKITGPSGGVDSSFKTYLLIDSEFMEYGLGDIYSDHIIVTRASYGSLANNHLKDTTVDNAASITGNIIDNALKLLLSGWGAQWISNCPIQSFVDVLDPSFGLIQHAMLLPDGVDAIETYGLAPGDYIYITGTSFNNGTYTVKTFGSSRGWPNNIVYVNETFVTEVPPSGYAGYFSIRSQYDVFPVNAGMKLRPTDIDVNGIQKVKRTFLSQADCTFQNLIKEPIQGKDFIESQYLLPSGLYSVTRFGRISIASTKPPIAGQTLVTLDVDNILNPESIVVSRGLNLRTFFNEIDFYYDFDSDNNPKNVTKILDSTSLNKITVASVLPINAQGLKTTLGADTFINRRGGYLLRRYRNAAFTLQIKVNWEAASMIQVSDCVALSDNGLLKISNLSTGNKDLGYQLFEVIDWKLDIMKGTGDLKLLSSPGYLVTDRFGVISPSSILDSGSTTSVLKFKDSFGALYPGDERQKWVDIIGEKILIHSPDWSYQEETTLVAINPETPYQMQISPSLSIAPPAGYIVEVGSYDQTSATTNQKSKALFCFIDPTDVSTGGIDNYNFTCANPTLYTVGLPVRIHNSTWSIVSSEANVTNISGSQITVDTNLGFTPTSGLTVELIGFKDGLGPYRIL